MMFAGTFWGFIEAFLFWHLDDLGATRFLMGWTVAVGMVTSLPFLIFSGPITDTIGHMNVIILGMLAYTGRLLGYSFITDPVYVYPFEALEGLGKIFTKNQDIINQLDATRDAFDEGLSDPVEVVTAADVALWSSKEFVATHFVYHEGSINLIVFV